MQNGQVKHTNRLYRGEMLEKSPAGLPAKQTFHKKNPIDHDWWLRHNDRSREWEDLPFTHYEPTSKATHDGFHAGGMQGQDHSRRVFMDLAHQGRSHSEGSLLALRTDTKVKKGMSQRYAQVMRKPAGGAPPPRPCFRPAPGSQAARAILPPVPEGSCSSALQPAESRVNGSSSSCSLGCRSQQREMYADAVPRASSSLSACAPLLRASSSLSACAPLPLERSELSACEPSDVRLSEPYPMARRDRGAPASMLSACAPAASAISSSSYWSGTGVSSQQPPSTASDFFSWRPRIIS